MENKLKPGPIQQEWIQSLKDHPERQTKFKLGVGTPENYKACCLGELALIAGIAKFKGYKIVSFRSDGSEISTGIADYETVGLRDPVGSCSLKSTDSLALYNDELMSWPEIAQHVEKNFENYFTKSV